MSMQCTECDEIYEEYWKERPFIDEKEKCILHSDKSGWDKIDRREFSFRYDTFWKEIDNLISEINKKNDPSYPYDDEISSYVFKDINFSFFNSKELGKSFYLSFDESNDENISSNIFGNLLKDIDIIFDNCIFEEEIDFTAKKFSNNIIFKKNCILKKGINFSNNSFSHKIYIKTEKLLSINCENTIFDNYVEFSNLSIENLNLNHTTFNENFNLIGSEIKNKFDISNTVFNKNINLVDLECEVVNRQSARMIKHILDQQGDIINANLFYTQEMNMQEKELSLKRDFFDWVVFKIHSLSSNHSQDWVLALLWILSLSIFYQCIKVNTCYYIDTTLSFLISLILLIGLNICVKKIKYLEKATLFIISIVVLYFSKISINDISNLINPFSIMTNSERLTIDLLIYKIIIGYLIYQFIISIRQNTRRS